MLRTFKFVKPLTTWIILLVAHRVVGETPPGFCGDCFCIPGVNQTCPRELEPNMNFTSFLGKLLEFEWSNPITLDCDPIVNASTCDLEPVPSREGGACVVDFVPAPDGSQCPQNWTYSIRTFAGTLEEAQSQGLYVTHAGPCGACSSLQDLHTYMARTSQLADDATACGIQGLNGAENGISCYQSVGFTRACATVWHYTSMQTREFCIDLCAELYFSGRPNNGPPPTCTLEPCIECDENNTGPGFLKYAGRTRRNSGLLSAIARTCSEFIPLPQVDPCPNEQTLSPTLSSTSGSMFTLVPSTTFMISSILVIFVTVISV